MEYTLYIGSKESKQDINTNILEICMHKAFEIQRRYDLDKTPKEFKKTQKGVSKHISCPNYINKTNQQMIYSTKFNK
jgi:hypothetical protein